MVWCELSLGCRIFVDEMGSGLNCRAGSQINRAVDGSALNGTKGRVMGILMGLTFQIYTVGEYLHSRRLF